MTDPNGTKTETAVCDWARKYGAYDVRRIPKAGTRDRGDVELVPRLVMAQVKFGYTTKKKNDNGNTTDRKEPTDYMIGQWLEKVDEQVKNGEWHIGLLVHKRFGKSDPDDWRWYMTGQTYNRLATIPPSHTVPYVQLQGYMIPPLLKYGGYPIPMSERPDTIPKCPECKRAMGHKLDCSVGRMA